MPQVVVIAEVETNICALKIWFRWPMFSTHGRLSFLFPTNYLISDYNAFRGVETPVQINLTESVSAKVVGFNCKFLIL